MADTKISALTSGAPAQGTDETVIARGGANYKLTMSEIAAFGGTGTVTSVGGTGTVSGLTLTGTVTTSGNLTLGGTLSVNLATSVTGTLPVANGGTGASATVQALSGAGAVNITSLATAFTSTAAGNALTLADGAQGQLKTIIYVAEAAGGDTGVLTPSNLGSGTTITFNAVGDSVTLQFAGTDWWVVGFRGAVVA